MEYTVTLHTANGDVRTAYPANQQSQAVALWQAYAAEGKQASLSSASTLPSSAAIAASSSAAGEAPLINLNASCPFCDGHGLHPYQPEGISDDELCDCPVCGGCGDIGTAVGAKIENLAKRPLPNDHFICQAVAAHMVAQAARLHARYKGPSR